MIDTATLQAALGRTLEATHLDRLGRKYEGKVRDNYSTADGRRYIVVTDRISARATWRRTTCSPCPTPASSRRASAPRSRSRW
jgi:RNase P subunit RPR2